MSDIIKALHRRLVQIQATAEAIGTLIEDLPDAALDLNPIAQARALLQADRLQRGIERLADFVGAQVDPVLVGPVPVLSIADTPEDQGDKGEI